MRRRQRNSPIVCGRGVMRTLTGYLQLVCPYPASRLNAMNLDVNTLFLVTIYVEAILGLLLLFAWVQNTAITAVAWWGFARSAARRFRHAVRHVRFGPRSDLDRSRQRDPVHRLCADLDRRAGVRSSQAAADPAVRRRRAVAGRLPPPGDRRTSWDLRVLLSVRHHHRLHLGNGVRILARPQRAAGVALAGDLHAVRPRRALSAAHAVRRHAAVVADWTTRCSRASGSPCSASRRCCSPSPSPSSCWPWRRSAPSTATRPPSLIDPLTGIANRRAFLQDGEAQLKRQATEPRPMAVMLLDLDNFKSINDRFGHAIGDRVLQMFAEVGYRLHAPHRPVRPPGRRGIRRAAVRHLARAGARRRRADPLVALPRPPARSRASRSSPP